MHWTFPFTKNRMKSSQILSFLWPTSENRISSTNSLSSQSLGGWSTLRRNLADEKISGWHKEPVVKNYELPSRSWKVRPWKVTEIPRQKPDRLQGRTVKLGDGYFYRLIWEGWCQMRCDNFCFRPSPPGNKNWMLFCGFQNGRWKVLMSQCKIMVGALRYCSSQTL